MRICVAGNDGDTRRLIKAVIGFLAPKNVASTYQGEVDAGLYLHIGIEIHVVHRSLNIGFVEIVILGEQGIESAERARAATVAAACDVGFDREPRSSPYPYVKIQPRADFALIGRSDILWRQKTNDSFYQPPVLDEIQMLAWPTILSDFICGPNSVDLITICTFLRFFTRPNLGVVQDSGHAYLGGSDAPLFNRNGVRCS